jgi:hypothetical protein
VLKDGKVSRHDIPPPISFPAIEQNRTCAIALSDCVCLIPFQPLLSFPYLHPYHSPCVSRIFLQQQPSALQKEVVFVSFFSNSLPHCKNQGYTSTFEALTKQKRSFGYGKEEKAHHSQQSAQHSHPSSQTKQQQSAAKQASRHPLSFLSLTMTCWGGPWFKFVRLLRVSYKGRVPDLLILHSGGKRLVSFLGHIGGAGAFTKTYGGGPC